MPERNKSSPSFQVQAHQGAHRVSPGPPCCAQALRLVFWQNDLPPTLSVFPTAFLSPTLSVFPYSLALRVKREYLFLRRIKLHVDRYRMTCWKCQVTLVNNVRHRIISQDSWFSPLNVAVFYLETRYKDTFEVTAHICLVLGEPQPPGCTACTSALGVVLWASTDTGCGPSLPKLQEAGRVCTLTVFFYIVVTNH